MTLPPRIAPLEPPYTPELAATLAKWMRPGSPEPPLALFRTLVRAEELSSRMRPLGSGLLGGASSLDPRDREIVIHRTCARCGCEYEWGVHAAIFGRELALGEATVRATVTAPAADPVWTPRQALLIRLTDELHDTAGISDGLWVELSREWNEIQRLELLILAGWYHLICYVANGVQVPLEAWAERFPEGAQRATTPAPR